MEVRKVVTISDSENEEQEAKFLKVYFPNSSKCIEVPLNANDGSLLFADIKVMEPNISALNLTKGEIARLWKPTNGYFKEPKEKWNTFKVVAVLQDSTNASNFASSSTNNNVSAARKLSTDSVQLPTASTSTAASTNKESCSSIAKSGVTEMPSTSLTSSKSKSVVLQDSSDNSVYESDDVKTDVTQKVEEYELPIVAGNNVIYEARKLIGRGGFGKVYRAVSQNKLYALKIGELDKEIKIRQKLIISTSKHIPRMIDFGAFGDEYFMVMDLLGENLHDFIENKPSPRLRLVLAGQCIQALEALHKMEILHKDIKADNFVLGPKNSPSEYVIRIIDFGLSARDGERNNVGKTINKYKSIQEHLGHDVSRKTELENLFYMVCDWLRPNKLPWSNKENKEEPEPEEMQEYKIQILGDKFHDFFGTFDARNHDKNYFYALAGFLENVNCLSEDAVPNYDIFHYLLNLAYQRAEKAEMEKLKRKKGKEKAQSDYDNENLIIKKFKRFEIGQDIFNKEAQFAYIANIARTKMEKCKWITEIKHVENNGIVLMHKNENKTQLNLKCTTCGFSINIDKIKDARIWKKVKIVKQNRAHSNCKKLLPPPDIVDLKEGDSDKMLEKADPAMIQKADEQLILDAANAELPDDDEDF